MPQEVTHAVAGVMNTGMQCEAQLILIILCPKYRFEYAGQFTSLS
jgi:hypothetical protein